jgi:RNA polymerase sigma-B factor
MRLLVEHYQGLARSLAIRSARPRDELDDLVQVAMYGLYRAIERFDPDRGVKFSTFGWSTIAGELKRHHRDRTWAVHVPRHLQEVYLRVTATVEELTHELGRPPTIAEIAVRSGDDEGDVLEAFDARHARHTTSLDVPIGDQPTVELPTVDRGLDDVDDRDLLRTLLDRLPDREREVLVLRFFEERSQSDIARRVGCSQMHVSRILSASIERLRQLAGFELSGGLARRRAG